MYAFMYVCVYVLTAISKEFFIVNMCMFVNIDTLLEALPGSFPQPKMADACLGPA